MRRGIDILVGTPGRILDHMNRGNLNLSVSAVYVYIIIIHVYMCPMYACTVCASHFVFLHCSMHRIAEI